MLLTTLNKTSHSSYHLKDNRSCNKVVVANNHYKRNTFFSTSKAYRQKDEFIPKLPIVESMAATVKSKGFPDLSATAFIGVQHMLSNTVAIFDGFNTLNAKYENMYFTGKWYSSSPLVEEVVRKRKINLMPVSIPEKPGYYSETCRNSMQKMWEQCYNALTKKKINRLIIIEEGGRCLETAPSIIPFEFATASIEQTRGGLYLHNNNSTNRMVIPYILTATSAAKQYLESPLIAESILTKVKEIIPGLHLEKTTIFGVVGNGAIGSEIAKYLTKQGYVTLCYDENERAFQGVYNSNFYRFRKLKDVLSSADYIFGCTGKNILQNFDVIKHANKPKTFISCSSEDKEFLSLLKKIAADFIEVDPRSDIICKSKNGHEIKILRGGFPINFDGRPVVVPTKDIELTRALVFGGCLQAILAASKPVKDGKTINEPTYHCLDPYIQRFVVQNWIKTQPEGRYPKELIKCFDDIEWIKKNSGGDYYENKFLVDCFEDAPSNQIKNKRI